MLENVTVQMEGDMAELVEEKVLPLAAMPLNKAGQTYVLFRRVEGACALGKFSNMLKFTVKEARAPAFPAFPPAARRAAALEPQAHGTLEPSSLRI